MSDFNGTVFIKPGTVNTVITTIGRRHLVICGEDSRTGNAVQIHVLLKEDIETIGEAAATWLGKAWDIWGGHDGE